MVLGRGEKDITWDVSAGYEIWTGKHCFEPTAYSFSWWLVLICSEIKVLLDGCWWLIYCERKILLAGG
jgi:hypothetical protein